MASGRVLDEWSPLARVYSPLQAGSIDGTDTEPHDRAVVRAMRAAYRPNHLVQGDPSATLFIARLHPDTTEETLEKTFSKLGSVKRVRLIRDVVTGFSKRYAFVEFENEDDARYAFRHAQSVDIDGVDVYVDYEIERSLKGWVPRRLGGGFGGKKESGQLRFGGRDRPFRKPILMVRDVREGGRDVLRLPESEERSDSRDGGRQWAGRDGDRDGWDRGRQWAGRDRGRDRRGEYRERRDSRERHRQYEERDRRRNDRDYDRYRDRKRSRSR